MQSPAQAPLALPRAPVASPNPIVERARAFLAEAERLAGGGGAGAVGAAAALAAVPVPPLPPPPPPQRRAPPPPPPQAQAQALQQPAAVLYFPATTLRGQR